MPVLLVCQQCDRSFSRPPSWPNPKFCSRACWRASDRFWIHVDKASGYRVPGMESDCWLWTGAIDVGGYGRITLAKYGRRHIHAHRIAWLETYGSIPDGLFVLHRCDMPCCVRPDHLFLGTHTDNMEDRAVKGRYATGEQHPRARLTHAMVVEMRELHQVGYSVSDIARRFARGISTVSRVIRWETWTG